MSRDAAVSDRAPAPTRRRLLAGVAALGAGLAGCGEQRSPADRGSGGGSLTAALRRTPVTLDPVYATDVASRQVVDLLFDGLYELDQSLEPVPVLADGEPEMRDGGTRYRVSLDTAARFQNGDPVTAADVAYSYRVPRLLDAPTAWLLDPIESVTAVDPATVRFDLAAPYPAFRWTLTWPVMPALVRESDPAAFATSRPIGSGRFAFRTWNATEYLLLDGVEDHWSGQDAALDRLKLLAVPNGTERMTALRSGKTGAVEAVPPPLWPTVERLDELRIESVRGLNYYYLGFNCRDGPTADRRVRRAVDFATDVDRAVQDVVPPAGEQVHGPLPPSMASAWGFPTDEWASIGHDRNVVRAIDLLADAETPGDWQPRILVPPDGPAVEVATRLAAHFAETGYDARVVRRGWRDYHRSRTSGEYDMFVGEWLGGPDPDHFLYPLLSEPAQGRTAGTFYAGAAEPIRRARRTMSGPVRGALYDRAVRTLLESRAHLPLYAKRHDFGLRNRVIDFQPHPTRSFTVATSFNQARVE
ncbi:MAG: ABC transporter substrate-binding protein [Halobacteriaceae archaeon]